MKIIIVILNIIGLQLVCFNSLANELCLEKSKYVGAIYSINHLPTKASHKNSEQASSFQIWRKDNDVLHIYPAKDISVKWHKLTNGDTRKVSYFESYKRGIEYEPTHLSEASWSNKYQLISEKLLAQMTLLSTEGDGCEMTEHYVLNNQESSIEVWWQPKVKLARKVIYKKEEMSTVWKLNELTFANDEVANSFAKTQNYQTTDYADIGDNESDPFLRKMIHLGFVESGSSGFYHNHEHN